MTLSGVAATVSKGLCNLFQLGCLVTAQCLLVHDRTTVHSPLVALAYELVSTILTSVHALS